MTAKMVIALPNSFVRPTITQTASVDEIVQLRLVPCGNPAQSDATSYNEAIDFQVISSRPASLTADRKTTVRESLLDVLSTAPRLKTLLARAYEGPSELESMLNSVSATLDILHSNAIAAVEKTLSQLINVSGSSEDTCLQGSADLVNLWREGSTRAQGEHLWQALTTRLSQLSTEKSDSADLTNSLGENCENASGSGKEDPADVSLQDTFAELRALTTEIAPHVKSGITGLNDFHMGVIYGKNHHRGWTPQEEIGSRHRHP
jgi:hypothetical protein